MQVSPQPTGDGAPLRLKISDGVSADAREKLADSVLSVISAMIKGGGHNPRELKDITQALKLALEARRAEDPSETDEAKKDEIEYVDTPLGELKIPRIPHFAHVIRELEDGDADT